MKQRIKFILARFLGKPHSRVLPIKDGVETTLVGYVWRGTFYAGDLKQKIVNPQAHRNALKQAGASKPPREEPRIIVPGGRR